MIKGQAMLNGGGGCSHKMTVAPTVMFLTKKCHNRQSLISAHRASPVAQKAKLCFKLLLLQRLDEN